MSAARRLHTPRLSLCASQPSMAAALCDYFARNAAHFAPWSPPQPESFLRHPVQVRRLAEDESQREQGTALRWWLFSADDAQRVIGQMHFSQIARGPFQNAQLGYQIDAAAEGRGLMREALQAGIAEVFGPRVRLHRIQANARPENRRSLALLDALGFRREGLARDYLFIDGAWRDHVMTALLNPAWPADEAP